MPASKPFSPSMQQVLLEMRVRKVSWDRIARVFSVSRSRVIEEGLRLGLEPGTRRHLDRLIVGRPVFVEPRGMKAGEPLPAWHEISRGVLEEAGLPVPPRGQVWR